jgi:hypothetical protein
MPKFSDISIGCNNCQAATVLSGGAVLKDFHPPCDGAEIASNRIETHFLMAVGRSIVGSLFGTLPGCFGVIH